MNVRLMYYTENPEQVISESAGICYSSENTPDKTERRLKKLLSSGHLSTLRFAYATFHISEISRTCSHQIVRTAHGGFLQKSQRYTNAKDELFIQPSAYNDLSMELMSDINSHLHAGKQLYSRMLESGVNKEDARFILPEGTSTELLMTGNFQMWYDWLGKRNNKKAQWEIRGVAELIQSKLHEIAKNIF